MGRTKARFSCLCWRSTGGVVEPAKLGADKIQLPCPQPSCPEARANKREPLVSKNASGYAPPKELVCEKFKQPCAGECEDEDRTGDVSDSNVTKTEPDRTHEEMNCLADAAPLGIQEPVEIHAGQMAVAPEVPKKNMKNSAELFPEERHRAASQETTAAEEPRGVSGDECGASQESEPGNETTVLPPAVTQVCLAASSAADLPESNTTLPAAQKTTNIDTGVDGLPETKQTAEDSESNETPISPQAVPPAQTKTVGDTNEPLGEKGRTQAEQLNVQSDVETNSNLPGKKTKSSSQDARQNAKRNKKNTTRDEAEPAPVMDTSKVVTEHEKEGNGDDTAGEAQNDGNTGRSKSASGPQRHQKKKKSSRAKGKRRHGKTGRR